MSGNNYGYYYGQNSSNSYNEKQWSDWSVEQQQYNNANFMRTPVYDTSHTSIVNHGTHSATHIPPRTPYYNYHTPPPQSNGRPYVPRRYNNPPPHQFSPSQHSQQSSWNRNSNYKRPRLNSDDPAEPKAKSAKKKKKPLSQNVPSKKDWTLEEAEMALNCEKEYNKRHKNQSLIIKFPDLELNKDIVSTFHNAIENVHFQQPSTARFCFVTLGENADADAVISALNKVKFGDGYLTAEYKKDREDDQNLGPEDIDPHTLYVGNLAQEITKEVMVKTYPKCKRIDIGYAKKMKYTRYAFVTFKSVIDSVEAFKKTHSTQMYSKSLIVRFRRLHGTVGMPGESKPQNPPKNKDSNVEETCSTSIANNDEAPVKTPDQNSIDESINLNLVKQEPESSDDDDIKEVPNRRNSTTNCDIDFVKKNQKVKTEANEPYDNLSDDDENDIKELKSVIKAESGVKEELDDDDEEEYESDTPYINQDNNESSEEDDVGTDMNISNLYAKLMTHANNASSVTKSGP